MRGCFFVWIFLGFYSGSRAKSLELRTLEKSAWMLAFLRTPMSVFYNYRAFYLCALRIDKQRCIEYNKARTKTSTAEDRMRSHPADFKQKGAKTDGRFGTRTVWTGYREPLTRKSRFPGPDVSPANHLHVKAKPFAPHSILSILPVLEPLAFK
jgi:hypothetical protein